MDNKKRLIKSFKQLQKAINRKEKAKAERIWIENNSHINLLNYPYYKLKKMILK